MLHGLYVFACLCVCWGLSVRFPKSVTDTVVCCVCGSQHHKREVCPRAELECPNRCGTTLLRIALAGHIGTQCPNHVVPCPFVGAGCTVSLMRKDLAVHIEQSAAQHLGQLFGVLTAEREITRDQVARLSSRVDRLESVPPLGVSCFGRFREKENERGSLLASGREAGVCG